jgi:hypothetical protein
MTTITTLPTPPSRSDPLNFAERADNFLGALPTFGDQVNAVASEINSTAINVEDNRALAEAAAGAATATANSTLWISGTTYTAGVVVYSPINYLSYRRKTTGAGTTDPSLDTTNWATVFGSGDVTQTGVQTLTNKTLNTPILNGTREKRILVSTNIDMSAGNYFEKVITGNTTFTVSNVPSSGNAQSIILQITNGGSFSVNWFGTIRWVSGIPPSLTSSGTDVIGFYTTTAGSPWYGFVIGKDVR